MMCELDVDFKVYSSGILKEIQVQNRDVMIGNVTYLVFVL